jgi:Rod binding domain-containing protein
MATSAISSFGPSPAFKAPTLSPAVLAKARQTAQDFESVFLNSMISQMNTGVGDGPFNGGQAAKTWRGLLTDEYAKNFSKAGGIGIADAVYKELIAQQEARPK